MTKVQERELIKVSVEELERLHTEYTLDELCEKYLIPEEYLDEYSYSFDWEIVVRYQPLSDEMIRKYRKHFNQVHWEYICYHQRLSEDIMEEFFNNLSNKELCKYQSFSEDFIRKHKKKMNWMFLLKEKQLSESFIEEHEQYIDYNILAKYQDLSLPFLIKKMDEKKILVHFVLNNQNLNKDTLNDVMLVLKLTQ